MSFMAKFCTALRKVGEPKPVKRADEDRIRGWSERFAIFSIKEGKKKAETEEEEETAADLDTADSPPGSASFGRSSSSEEIRDIDDVPPVVPTLPSPVSSPGSSQNLP